jgi:hypothetical protein
VPVPGFAVVLLWVFGLAGVVLDAAGGFVEGAEVCCAKAIPQSSVPARDNVSARYGVLCIF